MGSIKSSTAGQSLFIVDRDWLRPGSKARKSWTGNVRNRSLYGLAIELTDYDVPQKPPKCKKRLKGEYKLPEKSMDDMQHHNTLSSNAHSTTSSQPCHGPSLPLCSDIEIVSEATQCASIPLESFQSTRYGHFQHRVPRSAPFDSIKRLEAYLDYYLDVIGIVQHPLETRFTYQTSFTQPTWSPLAFEDDLWLQNVALLSAFRRGGQRKSSSPATVDALMSSFLSKLNDRISKSDLSDSTIASVSCLMLGEHIKGNDILARVHASGMAEMIRLRGGLGTIQRGRIGRIVRADIVRSVDTLEPPMLPRLTRDSVPLGPDLATPSNVFREKINCLQKSGISHEVVSTLWTLGSICETLQAAWNGYTSLDAASFYESILCINHDMLTFSPPTSLDEILKISIINFTQPMFRQCPFLEQNCRLRMQKLRTLLEDQDMSTCDIDLVLWIMFVSHMTAEEIVADRHWYRTKIFASLQPSPMSTVFSWTELKEQLRSFLWTESIHDQIGLHAYNSLESDSVAPSPSEISESSLSCIGSDTTYGCPLV